ncbi:protein deltex-like [Episyrphus balteatus]|uniref:protein deltex-like n=1 Tax=Episyrphus balteatus TaxID=286459 RepID=UPI002485FD9A|nr:protein deltex-like [Episyrphus balteatus]
MSSHSGTIGRKRGSEYYFGGEQMRRQRSAEWHSRHGYSSSEDEYQNNTQTSAFDTQLLASLLIQSQQLANLDRYASDCDNGEVTESLLTEYPTTTSALQHQQLQQQAHHQQQQLYHHQSTDLNSPLHSAIGISSAANTKNSNSLATVNSRNPFSMKYDLNTSSTNPFPETNDRLSYSGSSAMLDRLQAAVELNATSSAVAAYLQASAALNERSIIGLNSLRSSRSKSNRLNRVSGMTSSSSATSSNSAATSGASRSEREKQKLQQIQQDLREYAQCEADAEVFDSEPPPEPAPPEIPPRTQSLMMSLRKRSDYQLKYEGNSEQKQEEYISTPQQKDYLVADNSRSSENQSKSIASSDSQSQQG